MYEGQVAARRYILVTLGFVLVAAEAAGQVAMLKVVRCVCKRLREEICKRARWGSTFEVEVWSLSRLTMGQSNFAQYRNA